MPSIRCTKKLIKEMGRDLDAEMDPSPNDWYAKLIHVDRRKRVVFLHVGTLFCCVTEAVSRQEIRRLEQLLASSLKMTMLNQGFSEQQYADFWNEHAPDSIGKTGDRSILGVSQRNVSHRAVLC